MCNPSTPLNPEILFRIDKQYFLGLVRDAKLRRFFVLSEKTS